MIKVCQYCGRRFFHRVKRICLKEYNEHLVKFHNCYKKLTLKELEEIKKIGE